MHQQLKPGIKGETHLLVQQKDTAAAYGSGLLSVFATPAMIALMEKTAAESVQPLLEDGFGTVGTLVNIKHIKATALNRKVWAISELISIEGKKLTFNVEAFDEKGKIGFGTHIRYIINDQEFLQNLD
jgi:fluoroacetyl-CoA thioesterase